MQTLLVLMYHGIVTEWSVLPKEREAGADLYDVLLSNFQAQMQCLSADGYKVETINGHPELLGPKSVVLTFDDGEMNNYEQAFPVLKKHRFPAYFFIIASRVGKKGYMGWDELRELHDSGMVIGSHGFSHEILTNLLDTQIEEELKASKRYLEYNLKIPVDTLSIPRGFCNEKIIQMAYNVGYKVVFISGKPKALKTLCFSRVGVKATWSLSRFEQALKGKTPPRERIATGGINFVKNIFGGGTYDWIRRVLLKIAGRA